MPPLDMYWDYIVILALLAVFVPWRSASRIRDLLEQPSLASSERLYLYISTIVFQLIAAIVLYWRSWAHHVGASDLGLALPHPRRAIATIVVLATVLVVNQVFGLRRIAALPSEKQGIIPRLAERLLPHTLLERIVAVFLVITVAICEEFIYRGFIQTIFLNAFLASAPMAAVASAAFFAIAHLYQGRKGVVTTFAVGLIFSAARIWTGSLVPSIAVHFAVDLSAGIVAQRFLPTNQPAALVTLISMFH